MTTPGTVRDLMTADPECCTPRDSIAQAARRMASGDFGAVPVVDPTTRRLVGIVTDRDITCRAVAHGANPARTEVREVMSREVATLAPTASIHDCVKLMERQQVRRIPIVDDRGIVLGIVAQADIARASERNHELEHELAEMVEEVSEPPHVARAA